MQKPLILVSNHVNTYWQNGHKLLNNSAPRQDYVEISHRLNADILGYDLFDTPWYRWTRPIERSLKLDIIEALSAAKQSSKYNAVLSVSEKVAIPLAATLSMLKKELPHVVIGHRLSSISKNRFFSLWPLYRTFSHLICVCHSQYDYAINKLGVPASKVEFVYDKVDHHFFHPLSVDVDDYILAVGREQRDYETLLQAISGTGLKLVVVASSPWSTYQTKLQDAERVTVLRNIPYQDLRDLYARARLVVIPLVDVDYAAGVNSLLEAMAMGKAVITSRTRGIIDYVAHQETGLYVTPNSVEEMRDAILTLRGKSGELDRLGENARQVVNETMNLDAYVNRVVRVVHQSIQSRGDVGG